MRVHTTLSDPKSATLVRIETYLNEFRITVEDGSADVVAEYLAKDYTSAFTAGRLLFEGIDIRHQPDVYKIG